MVRNHLRIASASFENGVRSLGKIAAPREMSFIDHGLSVAPWRIWDESQEPLGQRRQSRALVPIENLTIRRCVSRTLNLMDFAQSAWVRGSLRFGWLPMQRSR